jgi:hypothetical protein
VPKTAVPPALQDQFAACTGGLCVPDPIIKQGSEYVPASCTTVLINKTLAGVCLSKCISKVSGDPSVSLLKPETCGQGELCVPCVNPLTMMSTGACSISTLVCSDGGSLNSDAGGGPTCPYTGPQLVDPTSFGPCGPACAGAHCLPAGLVPVSVQSQLASCMAMGQPGFCAPDPFIASAGAGLPKTCTSVAGAEGRCLSTCLPAVGAEASLLPQDVCAAGEKCAPCYNPVATDPTMPTGACALACDHPAHPPTVLTCPWTGPDVIDPTTLPACDSGGCSGSHCLPAAEVPVSVQSQLAHCNNNTGFCAPDTLIKTGNNSIPPTCVSIAGSEGRCLSTCLPLIASEANLLPQSTCATNERCAPCYDPTATDPRAATGACSLGCDHPAHPPTILTCPWTGPNVIDPNALPACDNGGCGGAHCLPAAQVPPSVQGQLAHCANNTGFCAPDPIIATANNYVPPTCDPFPGSGAPGRCLSGCLPDVAAKVASGTLVRSSCASGNYCVPCNDPFNGTSTGACTLACDTPPTTAFKFPHCCNDGTGSLTGTCVPSSLVPSGQASSLNQSGNGNSSPCPNSGANYLCVPDEYLPSPYNIPPISGCLATIFNFCGVCVSQCVVNSTLNLLTQSTCAAHHKCVECALASTTPGCSQFCP